MKNSKKQRFCKAALGAIASVGFLAFLSPAGAQSSGPNLPNPNENRFVKGRILVQPRPGLASQEFDKKLKAHGARRVGAIAQINVHVVELPAHANEHALAQLLRSDPHIRFAEVDQSVPPSLMPNDPSYASGWHLPQINAPGAWDASAGEGVTIAILDSGVDATHPDLAASMVPGYNFFDNNTDTRDVYGHGTKVAGAAAMVGNNLAGGTGVAFKSKIMPVRVAGTDGYGNWSAMAKGIIWAADRGAKVANLSFQQSCGSSTLWSAAQYMRSKGGVVTISAGNSGVPESMAPSDTITCVGATDSADNKASWSTYGDFVDIAAPGVGIYTTIRGGGYGSVSGTSFAAPITAGVYALMIAANPMLTPSQLDAALFSTAVDRGATGKDGLYGYGRVDALAATAKVRSTTSVDATAPAVSITSPSMDAKVSGLVPVDVSASDNAGVARVDLYAGGTLIGSDSTSPYGFSVDTTRLPDGQLLLEARAVDAVGNVGDAKMTLSVANQSADATPPSVTISNPQSGAVVSSAIAISANATDDKRVAKLALKINGSEVAVSYSSSLSYTWDPYAGGKGKGKGRGKNQTSTSASGNYSLTATATDDAGNTRTATVNVVVP